MTLSGKKALVYDKGLYLYLAEKLGESFGKVYYYIPNAEPYPRSPKEEIGVGIKNVERVYDLWKYIKEVDVIVFFDIYEGDFQYWLRSNGYRVFGSGRSEEIEINRVLFYKTLKGVGLPVTEYKIINGLNDLEDYLKKNDNKWLKTSYYRGDFETWHHISYPHTKPWLDDLRKRLGIRSNIIEVIAEDPIESEAEAGFDGFCIDGRYSGGVVGYEVKDQGYVGKYFNKLPDIIELVNKKMSKVYKNLGYQGCYSTEIRITKNGDPYFIDACCRAASPPSALLCEWYENYAEAVWMISGGEIPEIKVKEPYGSEIVLLSSWHEDSELCVEYPPRLERWVKLKNHTKREGNYICIPNDNAGCFGSTIATGKTVDKVCDLASRVIGKITAVQLDIDGCIFESAKKKIKSGERFGIYFGEGK